MGSYTVTSCLSINQSYCQQGVALWPLPMVHWTSPYTAAHHPPPPPLGPHCTGTPHANIIWWSFLEMCSNLFTWRPPWLILTSGGIDSITVTGMLCWYIYFHLVWTGQSTDAINTFFAHKIRRFLVSKVIHCFLFCKSFIYTAWKTRASSQFNYLNTESRWQCQEQQAHRSDSNQGTDYIAVYLFSLFSNSLWHKMKF